MSAVPSPRVLYEHPDLGRIFIPQALVRTISLPGKSTRRADHGELGILVATQKRPVLRDGKRRMELIWHSIGHNARQNIGAAATAKQMFGVGTGAPTISINGVSTVIAIANAALTIDAGGADQSLGTNTAGVTTHEYTTLGLSRLAGTLGTYTAPTADAGTFTQLVSKLFTATGAATAYGAGLLDSLTVASALLYAEGNFASNAILATNDTLTVQASPSN